MLETSWAVWANQLCITTFQLKPYSTWNDYLDMTTYNKEFYKT